ncbi:MAG: 3-oxoacyl-[acyl-carrier-protein] reductase [Magnetococcales bacterium]|nr:3-oxoacyl-[acyl-carrier-protein] reductase [Magnetococcales bacterium]
MMSGRVAMVTGSTSGIGRVIALELARLGAVPVVVSIEGAKIPETLEELRAVAPAAEGFEADVSSQASVEAAMDQTLAKFGRLDILVNNAGITRDNLVMRMKDAEWDQVLAINLTSVFYMTRLALKPMLKARYGRIVNIASVVGLTGNPGQANYSASKAGVMGLTKSTAREVASRGITANCVAPGFIATAMTHRLNPKAQEAILSQIPMGEMGSPQDVANAVAFLASEEARYITGETLNVNGGMYMGF